MKPIDIVLHTNYGQYSYDRNLTIPCLIKAIELIESHSNLQVIHTDYSQNPIDIKMNVLPKLMPQCFVRIKANKIPRSCERSYGDRVVIRKCAFDQSTFAHLVQHEAEVQGLAPIVTHHQHQDDYYLIKNGIIPLDLVIGTYHASYDILPIERRRNRCAYALANAIFSFFATYPPSPTPPSTPPYRLYPTGRFLIKEALA